MVQSTARTAHEGELKAHRKVDLYQKRPQDRCMLGGHTFSKPAGQPKEELHPFEARFLAMGLSAETAKVVGTKAGILEDEQRRKISAEMAATAQFRTVGGASFLGRTKLVQRKTKHQKLIAFDLDETLVHSSFDLTDADHIIRFPTEDGDIREVGVRVRPHAIACLQELSSHFEIAVFTASIESYARPVLDLLDPTHSLIQHCLFRDSCLSLGPFLFKDLRVFRDFGLKDVLMVDNSAVGFALQRENGVPVNSWVMDEKDEELAVLAEYLKLFKTIADVRPFNFAVFSFLYCH